MTIASLLAIGAIAFAVVRAQGSAPVPTGVPIAGNYTGALRPQIHFSPPEHFMNDPNGMFIDAEGTYHLYYQYNPTDIVAGNQHWGHATSKDLYHWENQQIAIFPDTPEEGIFSGSAVVDVNNTSGFFPNQTNGVVAIYTLNTPQEETQEIAYSTDGGYTFTKYSGNPVISINSTQFRDPKVIWHAPTSKWVMVVSYAQEFTIGIFTSSNLKQWTHASNFTNQGLLGLQYECPNMVTIPMNGTNELMYVLMISINPGAPQGGSITQYFPGSFNGTHFTAVDNAARIADFGKDNYAGQFFYGTPDGQPPIFIAWASNWEYSQVVPTGPLENWRSAMSLPRVNTLANITRTGYDLVSLPYDLSTVYDTQIAKNSSLGNGTLLLDYSTVASGAVYFEANVTGIPTINTTGTLNFTFTSSTTGESLRGGFFFGGDTPFWLDRGKIGGFDNPFFTDKFSTNNIISNGKFQLQGVIDRSIFEVFLDGGIRSAIATFFPEGPLDQLAISAGDLNPGVKVSVNVWGLKSAWAAEANSNGTVTGNSTTAGNSTASRRGIYGKLE
ncbi:glycoside hydrolase family 32 protein [Xylona heveae TC161]|uniref:Glycoside hydrolase family 32 protein n=1 Tax=Xylona heveae (strain CBS 132557 / TC161) TaxID=1328760 RepID=A0A165IJF8_XYLHT|nr:glycoside hydrolase family 32 protein [Xylona heveae TC161]KZF24979.1 glycoside hydrolase family 32 protein [Xylona heveae TC161]